MQGFFFCLGFLQLLDGVVVKAQRRTTQCWQDVSEGGTKTGCATADSLTKPFHYAVLWAHVQEFFGWAGVGNLFLQEGYKLFWISVCRSFYAVNAPIWALNFMDRHIPTLNYSAPK